MSKDLRGFTNRWVGLTGETLLGAAMLILLAFAVKTGYLASADAELAQWMEAMRTPSIDAAARALTFFGSSPWTLLVMVVMSLWWLYAREYKTLKVFWMVFLCGFVIQSFLRYLVAQWRPDSAAVSGPVSFISAYHLAGFTSGHAFRSAFLYGWWAEWLVQRRKTLAGILFVACGILIVTVGWTRIYLNRHWATDVVGAWVIAALMLSIAKPLLQKFGRTQKLKGT